MYWFLMLLLYIYREPIVLRYGISKNFYFFAVPIYFDLLRRDLALPLSPYGSITLPPLLERCKLQLLLCGLEMFTLSCFAIRRKIHAAHEPWLIHFCTCNYTIISIDKAKSLFSQVHIPTLRLLGIYCSAGPTAICLGVIQTTKEALGRTQ